MKIVDLIKAVQEKLGLTVDGVAGPKTWAAIAAAVGVKTEESTPNAEHRTPNIESPEVDARSEANIVTLLPAVRGIARGFLFRLNAELMPFTAKIISGTRTYEEQDALYAEGRTKPGAIVTNARAGYSNHNFGIAFDIGIFTTGGHYADEMAERKLFSTAKLEELYRKAGAIGKELGLLWGGDWKSIEDMPHFEWHPSWAASLTENAMLAELRTRKAKGQAIA
jgi:peptidoglycan L-alanyl-D-glutamate endopeptidase CwlK